MTTLNPATEMTSPARPIQSPTVIFIGSWTVNLEKGRATLTLFLGDTTLGAERDLVAREVPTTPCTASAPECGPATAHGPTGWAGPSRQGGSGRTAITSTRPGRRSAATRSPASAGKPT